MFSSHEVYKIENQSMQTVTKNLLVCIAVLNTEICWAEIFFSTNFDSIWNSK